MCQGGRGFRRQPAELLRLVKAQPWLQFDYIQKLFCDVLKLGVNKLKVAVIGFGKMGVLHDGILNVLPKVRLVAVCEKSGLIRRFMKKLFKDVFVVDDVSGLSDLGLDAVYVTTPISCHFAVVKSIYNRRVASNVFVEKPLASNYGEARELCDLALKFGGVNMVGYMRRFSVTFKKAKELLNQGVIGEPISFSAYTYSSDFFGVDKNSKAHTPKISVLRDLGCHAIDLALWFFGDFKVKNAKVDSLFGEDSEDSVFFEVETEGGVGGKFNVSWCVDGYRMPEVGFTVEGSKGFMRVNDNVLELSLNCGEKLRWFRHDLKDGVGFWLGAPEYYREDECFVEAVLRGGSVEPCFETAAKVDRLIDEVLVKAGRVG
jgi:predicted dehydrogenase